MQECLHTTLVACGQGVDKEQAVPQADERRRPADLLLRHWEGGRHLAVDITIRHGWQQCQERAASREKWRKFLVDLEAAKHGDYDDLCKLFLLCKQAGWGFKAIPGVEKAPTVPNCLPG